jgi:hypothetical protein
MHQSDECACGCHGHQDLPHYGGGGCSSGQYRRRYYSKEETIKQLEEYVEQLQAEAKGVEEYIVGLKKAK